MPIPPKFCAQSDPPSFQHNDFDQYPFIVSQPWELAKNVQLVLIRSRPRAFQRAIDEPCTSALSTQRVAQNAILLFLPVKFNFCRKTSATKFLCAKTSRGKVVATSVFYLTVYRWIAGDVSIYLKFALKVTHPLRKHRFWQISFNSAAAVKASEIVQSSLTGSRQCAFHRAIDEPCALSLSPQRVAQKEIFTFCVAFYIFVAGNRRHFKVGMQMDHSKSQPTQTNCPWKGRGHCHVISLTFEK